LQIDDLENKLDRSRREAYIQAERDSDALATASQKAQAYRTQLDECRLEHDQEMTALRGRIRALEKSCERSQLQCRECHEKLQLYEYSRISCQTDAAGSAKLLREGMKVSILCSGFNCWAT